MNKKFVKLLLSIASAMLVTVTAVGSTHAYSTTGKYSTTKQGRKKTPFKPHEAALWCNKLPGAPDFSVSRKNRSHAYIASKDASLISYMKRLVPKWAKAQLNENSNHVVDGIGIFKHHEPHLFGNSTNDQVVRKITTKESSNLFSSTVFWTKKSGRIVAHTRNADLKGFFTARYPNTRVVYDPRTGKITGVLNINPTSETNVAFRITGQTEPGLKPGPKLARALNEAEMTYGTDSNGELHQIKYPKLKGPNFPKILNRSAGDL